MPVLGLNTAATFYPVVGMDQAGDKTYGAGVPTRVAIIKQNDMVQQTPIRSEASATHGRAEEAFGNIIAMVLPTLSINEGDRLDALGVSMEAISIFPMEDGFGRLDHQEVTLKRLITTNPGGYTPKVF